jgi:hypothetical protein
MPWNWDVTESGYYPFETGQILEPDQHYTTDLTPMLPADKYNTAEINVAVFTAFADRVPLADQTKDKRDAGTLKPGDEIESDWNLKRTSWVATLAGEPRSLHVAYGRDICPDATEPLFKCPVPRDYGLYVAAGFGSSPGVRVKPFDEYSPRTATVFGLALEGAYQDIPLDARARK